MTLSIWICRAYALQPNSESSSRSSAQTTQAQISKRPHSACRSHSRTAHVAEFRIPLTLAPLTAHDITPGGGAPGGHGGRCGQAQSRAIGVVACGPRSDQARREAGDRSTGEPAGRREEGGAGGRGVFRAGAGALLAGENSTSAFPQIRSHVLLLYLDL